MLNNMKRKLEMLISKTLYVLYIFPFYIINFFFRIKKADKLFKVVSFFRFITAGCLSVAFWIYNNAKDGNVFVFVILLILFLISLIASIIDSATLAAMKESKEKFEEAFPIKQEYYLVDYSTKKELDITNNNNIEIFINSCEVGKRSKLKNFPEFIQMMIENKQEVSYQKNIRLSFWHKATNTFDTPNAQNVCLRFLFDVLDDNTCKALGLMEFRNQELAYTKRSILEELEFEFVTLKTYKGTLNGKFFGAKIKEERTFIDAKIKIFASESKKLQTSLEKIKAGKEIETLKTKLNLIAETKEK